MKVQGHEKSQWFCVHLPTYLSTYLSKLSIYLSARLSVYLSVCQAMYLSISLLAFVSRTLNIGICAYIYTCICIYIYLNKSIPCSYVCTFTMHIYLYVYIYNAHVLREIYLCICETCMTLPHAW